MYRVIFSHGKDSSPNSTKIGLLRILAEELGFQNHAIDYTTCQDVNARLALLQGVLETYPNDRIILVGSSMGGYVSLAAANLFVIDSLFLMCPALYMDGYDVQSFLPLTNNIEIIHGWHDEVVPAINSIRFAQSVSASLHLVSDNHRLTESLELVGERFTRFLEQLRSKKH